MSDQGSEDPAAPHRGGRQYILELLSELNKVIPSYLRGEGKFPPQFELRYAPAQFRSILAIAERLTKVNWNELPPELPKGVEESLSELLNISDVIQAAPGIEEIDSERAREVSEHLSQGLAQIQNYFNNAVEPAVDAAEEQAQPDEPPPSLSEDELEEIGRLRETLERSRAEVAQMKAQQEEIAAELEARNDLVEATRVDTGSSGAEDLSDAYSAQAEHHERQWKVWGVGLATSVLAALGFGYLLLKTNTPPDDASTAQLVSHLALDLLVVGLLIYAVRVSSRQFSVHRHLAAVASNKAAALNTFARIVSSGSSAETRDKLAEVLAHYVFVSDNSGFLDGAGDQVTIPERLLDSLAQRVNGA